jgi:uncharacterized protein DUF3592
VIRTPRTNPQGLARGAAILGWALLILFAVLVVAHLVQYARISMSPQSAFGVVREKTAEEDRGEGLVDQWVLRYSFTAASGLVYQGRAGVSRTFYNGVDLGDRVEVEYAEDDPGNNRLSGEVDPDFVAILALMALNACLFAFAGVREVVRRVARRTRTEPSGGRA